MADGKRDRQAKIQAQAVNPEGASLTVDEGSSFVDRCSSECVSNKAWERGACCCSVVMLHVFGEWVEKGITGSLFGGHWPPF